MGPFYVAAEVGRVAADENLMEFLAGWPTLHISHHYKSCPPVCWAWPGLEVVVPVRNADEPPVTGPNRYTIAR